jgi:hypothetical protein
MKSQTIVNRSTKYLFVLAIAVFALHKFANMGYDELNTWLLTLLVPIAFAYVQAGEWREWDEEEKHHTRFLK